MLGSPWVVISRVLIMVLILLTQLQVLLTLLLTTHEPHGSVVPEARQGLGFTHVLKSGFRV